MSTITHACAPGCRGAGDPDYHTDPSAPPERERTPKELQAIEDARIALIEESVMLGQRYKIRTDEYTDRA